MGYLKINIATSILGYTSMPLDSIVFLAFLRRSCREEDVLLSAEALKHENSDLASLILLKIFF